MVMVGLCPHGVPQVLTSCQPNSERATAMEVMKIRRSYFPRGGRPWALNGGASHLR